MPLDAGLRRGTQRLGIVVGPYVLGLVKITPPIELLSDLGLSALIFLAGFELDLPRVRGRPLELATGGWLLSVVLGLACGLVLQVTGVIVSELYVGLALTTTALGIRAWLAARTVTAPST